MGPTSFENGTSFRVEEACEGVTEAGDRPRGHAPTEGAPLRREGERLMGAQAALSVRFDLSVRSMRRIQRALTRAARGASLVPSVRPRVSDADEGARHALAERLLREFLRAGAAAGRSNAQYTSQLTRDEQALVIDALNRDASDAESDLESDDFRRLRNALERAFRLATTHAHA